MYDEAPPLAADEPPPMPSESIRSEPSSPEQGASVTLSQPRPEETFVAPPPGRARGGPPEHHTMVAQQPTVDVYGPPPGPGPMRPPPPQRVASPYYTQAIGQSGPPSRSMLGLALVTVAGAVAAGAKYGGWAGAGAGALVGGGAVNAVRAVRSYTEGTDEADREGRISAFYAIVGLGGGGFVAYRYARPDRMRANEAASSKCDIRPVGP